MLGGHQESQAERSCEEDGSVLSSLLHSQVYGAAGNICLELQRVVKAGDVDVWGSSGCE